LEIKVYPISEKDSIEDLIRFIRQSQAERIVLFAEGRCPVLRDAINLRLIRYYSEERGVETVVIAKDPEIRKAAERVGLYRNDMDDGTLPTDSQLALEFAAPSDDNSEVTTQNPKQRPNTLSVSGRPFMGRMLTAIAFACMALVIGIYALLSPRVTLVVYPVTEDKSLIVQPRLSIALTEKDLEKDGLPGRKIEYRGNAEHVTRSTGKKTVGYRSAKAKVTFINSQAKSIIVPKGTELLAKSGVAFVTLKDTLVPAKSRKEVMGVVTGETYGQSDAEVEAVEKGTSGNVPRRTIKKISGRLSRELQVVNFGPAIGGENRQVSIVTEEDTNRATEEAKRQMELAAPEELKNAMGNGFIFLPELVAVQPFQSIVSGKPGDQSEQVRVTVSYSATAVVLSQATVYKYLNLQFHRELPTYLKLSGEKYRIKSIAARPGSDGFHQLTIQAETKVKGNLDRRRILRQILGKETSEAREDLAQLPEVGKYNIQAPDTMKRLPRFGFQVRLVLPATR
jgi:hypothetical protein